MNRVSLMLLVAAAAVGLIGCSDGGPVGTGISGESGISGNVVSVDDGGGSGGALGVEVRVSIDEVPGLDTETDDDGNFALNGDFSGAVTLRFSAADLTAAQPIDIPDDADVVLENVALSPGGVSVDTIRLLGFYGQVSLVDCSDGTILVNDHRAAANQFMVHLSSGTVLSRADGKPLQCSDISPGNAVGVEGVIRFAQHAIEAITLTVGVARPGSPSPVLEISFHGRAVVINCPGGMMLLDDPTVGRTRLRLSADTVISDGEQQSIACKDITLGDSVSGRGTVNIRRPGVVDALTIAASPPSS